MALALKKSVPSRKRGCWLNALRVVLQPLRSLRTLLGRCVVATGCQIAIDGWTGGREPGCMVV